MDVMILYIALENYHNFIKVFWSGLSENPFFKFSDHIILLSFILFVTIFRGLVCPIFSFWTVSPNVL